jgi:hypothetical protein
MYPDDDDDDDEYSRTIREWDDALDAERQRIRRGPASKIGEGEIESLARERLATRNTSLHERYVAAYNNKHNSSVKRARQRSA